MLVIGREPGADLVLPEAQVSARHALLESLGEGVFRVRDLGSANGTFVGGQRIRDARISWGDDLRFGSVRFDWGSHGSLLRAMATGARAFLLGREPGNDLVLADPRVSSTHLAASPQPDESLLLVDLGSANGTFVNGRRVSRTTVRRGDAVACGSLAVDLFRLLEARGLLATAVEGGGPAPAPLAPSREPAAAAPPPAAALPADEERPAPKAKRPTPAIVTKLRRVPAKVWAGLAAAVVLAGVTVGTWIVARGNWQRMNGEIGRALAEVEEARAGWTDAEGEPASGSPLRPRQAEAYLQVLAERGSSLDSGIGDLRSGKGLLLWYPFRKGRQAEGFAGRLARERDLGETVRGVLAEVAGTRAESETAAGTAARGRGEAAAVLVPASDEADLARAAAGLAPREPEMDAVADRVAELAAGAPTASRRDRFRKALLSGIAADAADEAGRVRGRLVSLARAGEELRQLKERAVAALAEGAGLVAFFESVTHDLFPTLEVLGGGSEQLLGLIGQARQPMSVGVVGTALSILGGGGPVSPLSVVGVFFPQVGEAIDGTEALCRAIVTVRDGMRPVAEVSARLTPILASFQETRSRAALLAVHRESDAAISALRSVGALADPVIARANEAERWIDDFASAARRAKLPFVSGLFDQVAGAAGQLVGTGRQVAMNFRQSMENGARSFAALQALEGAYRERLEALRASDEILPRGARPALPSPAATGSRDDPSAGAAPEVGADRIVQVSGGGGVPIVLEYSSGSRAEVRVAESPGSDEVRLVSEGVNLCTNPQLADDGRSWACSVGWGFVVVRDGTLLRSIRAHPNAYAFAFRAGGRQLATLEGSDRDGICVLTLYDVETGATVDECDFSGGPDRGCLPETNCPAWADGLH